MKKKFRTITVNGTKYEWRAGNGWVEVNWLRVPIITKDIIESSITPKIVSELIEKWQSDLKDKNILKGFGG